MINDCKDKDIYYMNIALKQAMIAYNKGEVPVGCVIVKDDVVIAKSYNKRQKKNSCFGHAEIEAINKANKKLNSWMLDDCTMYVTLEPCLMCSGAIMQSRIKRVVYAAKEHKFGCMGSLIDITNKEYKFNHTIELTTNILEEKSSELLKQFFKTLRQSKK